MARVAVERTREAEVEGQGTWSVARDLLHSAPACPSRLVCTAERGAATRPELRLRYGAGAGAGAGAEGGGRRTATVIRRIRIHRVRNKVHGPRCAMRHAARVDSPLPLAPPALQPFTLSTPHKPVGARLALRHAPFPPLGIAPATGPEPRLTTCTRPWAGPTQGHAAPPRH